MSVQQRLNAYLLEHSAFLWFKEPVYHYKIVERNHEMRSEYWGGYSRHNELYQQKYDLDGVLLDEKLVVKNSALMMYSPFLQESE